MLFVVVMMVLSNEYNESDDDSIDDFHFVMTMVRADGGFSFPQDKITRYMVMVSQNLVAYN